MSQIDLSFEVDVIDRQPGEFVDILLTYSQFDG